MTSAPYAFAVTLTTLAPLFALAQPAPAAAQETPTSAQSGTEWTKLFGESKFSATARTLYYSSHNNFWSGRSQDTISYGGSIGYKTGSVYGLSAGVSGLLQRGISHSDNPDQTDFNLGPDITALGEAYLQWEKDQFKATLGNQQLQVPYATYDFRIVPQLFRGLNLRMGDADNYVTAFRMTHFKSYTSEHFTRTTTYNAPLDTGSPARNRETDGFWGIGGATKRKLGPVQATGQAWFFDYQDYARLFYAEGQIARGEGEIRPFAGAQILHEDGTGAELAGKTKSRVFGAQLGMRRNSLTATLGYNRITPEPGAYLNGALVTPYAHRVASGPLFAQPFLSSTQDLGAGNAYAIDIKASPAAGWFVGTRFSYMDLKSSAAAPSLKQREYLAYASYNFSGSLKGLSIIDFLALQQSPIRNGNFIQNRLTVQYAW